MTGVNDDLKKRARIIAEAMVDQMCLTYRHDYWLMEREKREAMRRTFEQIAEHNVMPAIANALMAERERCANVVREISHKGMKESWWREKFESAANEVMKSTK